MSFNFDQLKIGAKGLIPIGLMGVLLVGITTLSVLRLNDLVDRYGYLTEHADPAMAKLIRSHRHVSEIGYFSHMIIDFDGDKPIALYANEEFKTAVQRLDELFADAAQLLPARAKDFIAFRDRARSIAKEAEPAVVFGLNSRGVDHGSDLTKVELDGLAKGIKILDGVDNNIKALIADIRSYNEVVAQENKRLADDVRRQAGSTVWTLVIVGALALVGGFGFSIWLSTRKISQPISLLSEQMEDVARGNLNVEILGARRGDEIGAMAQALIIFKEAAIAKIGRDAELEQERRRNQESQRKAEEEAIRKEREMVSASIGAGLAKLASKDLTFRMTDDLPDAYKQLQKDFNAALAQLEAALSNISEGARAITGTTQEISGAADDLSKRTEQQAAALEETTAALREITGAVHKAADGAAHGADIVEATKTEAEHSVVVVGQAVDAMGRIEKSSQEISQIIGVIDEIAFQTNLLALNAGVEAARAGDAGKGFAVVASEVRALAQRSAEAAKEIKSLISTSSSQVVQGVQLVDQTGKALEKIVVQFEEINRVVGSIANGAKEQAASLAEVDAALDQMDQNTQKNAAMVEETTAATHGLRREIEELDRKVGEFHVDNSRGGKFTAVGAAARASSTERPMLKTVAGNSGSAVRKTSPQVHQDSWAEF